MLKYKFCTVTKALAKPFRFRRVAAIDKIGLLSHPRVLKLVREKLGLLSFLFTDLLVKEFEQSDYSDLYKKSIEESVAGKVQMECLDFLLPSQQEQLGAYINFLYNQHQWKVVISRELAKLTDLSTPHKWYPDTRKIRRRFIFHHGPTNSGKTRSAVEALEQQRENPETGRGIYMAPLRLLAWQIQQRLSPCNLITGQQKIVVDSKLTSCTIQTANLIKDYKVAVIDEIQMIGDKDRGWGWTKALLNTKSEVIHICGQSRPVQLISKILALTGDTLEQKKYPRLSRLFLERGLFKFKDLKPGDCIIAFSTKKLHEIRLKIFKQFGKRSAIIYGKLPPEVRKKQAEAFNSGALPILVSTNAIGMGLNLQIKRIIFYQTEKIQVRGGPKKPLDDYMIQQIAGRAGRGLTDGSVFCMNRICFGRVKNALKNVNQTLNIRLEQSNIDQSEQPIEVQQEDQTDYFLNRPLSEYQKSISHGMLFIEYQHLQTYFYTAQYLNTQPPAKIKLSKTIDSFFNDVKTADHYSLIQAPRFSKQIAKFQNIGLTALQSFNFFNIPDAKNNREFQIIIRDIAKQFITRDPVNIPAYIVSKLKDNLKLKELESLYSLLQAYIWLSNKYQLAFIHSGRVIEMKENICIRINEKLRGFRIKEEY